MTGLWLIWFFCNQGFLPKLELPPCFGIAHKNCPGPTYFIFGRNVKSKKKQKKNIVYEDFFLD